jgi:hypothetical protein
MDGTLAAKTMVQQSMTKLSGAETEQEKLFVVTKVVLRLLKNNANNK